MLSQSAPRACVRAALRTTTTTSSPARLRAASTLLRARPASPIIASTFRRALSASPRSRSLIPDAENPPPKQSETSDPVVGTQPTDISLAEYHEHADKYLEVLQSRLEDKQDAGEGVEVEFSVRSIFSDCYGRCSEEIILTVF